MQEKYYDVKFDIIMTGYMKVDLARVAAKNPLEAVVEAIASEAHNIYYTDVQEQVYDTYSPDKGVTTIVVDDIDFTYRVVDVVELAKFPIEVHGKQSYVLLPKLGVDTGARLPGGVPYFVGL